MLRKRSASLNSMRITDFRTMNPSDKFVSPRPPPPVPGSPLPLRAGTAPLSLGRKRSSRSLSPAPGSQFSWSARRLFGLRPRDSERGRADSLTLDDQRSYTPSEGSSRSRDISPESLRRFLQDDGPCSLQTTPEEELPCFNIPEDIAEEEDDDNFATSAVSESRPFPTLLSPPPLRNTAPTSIVGSADASEMSAPAQDEKPKGDDAFPVSRFSMSSIASSFAPPASPRSAAGDEQDPPSFFDDSNDDEDELYSQPDEDEDEVDRFTFRPLQVNIDGLDGAAGTSFGSSASLFSGYTLPRAAETAPDGSPDRKRAATVSLLRPSQPADDIMNALGSPALVARNAENGGMPMGNTSLLAAPTDSGLDDLVQELGWMADVISGKR